MADDFTSLLSGGLIDTSAPNYAKVAGRNEKKRQGIIRLGLNQINSVFGGGTAPFYTPALQDGAKFNRKNTYYNLSGRTGEFQPYWAPGGAHPKGTFEPNMLASIAAGNDPGSQGVNNALFGDIGNGALAGAMTLNPLGPVGGALGGVLGNLFGKGESPREKASKQFRRGQLFNAPTYQTFEGFQDPFYEKRAQDYVNFALPQLGDQYRNTRNSMLFGLANRGLGDSSVASSASSNLEREVGKGRQTIADTGLAQANQLRRDVEGARQQAIQQLYQSADPAQALQGAVRTASGFQAPSTFAPIANMFTNLAQQYATQQLLNNYRQPFGGSEYDGGNFLAPIPG